MIFKNKLSFRQVKRSDNWLLGGNQLLEALKKKVCDSLPLSAFLFSISYAYFSPMLSDDTFV